MTLALPPPKVPDLQPDNTIDLDQLGNESLSTYIWYPGIAIGDFFWPNWRGCSADGQVVDFFASMIEVDGNLVPEGMPLPIANDMLKALDQGWVFYSYMPVDLSQPDSRGEESLRRFFYVGKRPALGTGLAVPQCKESHDLGLDPALLDAASVWIVTLPYRAMLAGDKVTLLLDLYFAENDPLEPKRWTQEVTADQVGQPLSWEIDTIDLLFIEGGFALMSYSVEYASPTAPTESATQRLGIIKPLTPLLPVPRIQGDPADLLDPEDYLDGMTVHIDLYPGIQNGDDVVLYATSGNDRQVKTLRVDPSTIGSGVLQFSLDYAWLAANNGKPLELIYQYARTGAAGTGEPLSATLRRALNLPPPMVERALPEDSEPGEYKGYIFASDMAHDGVYINVPDEAVIGAGDRVQMHWAGFGTTGSHIADPMLGKPRRFNIPPTAVPANMAKRVDVYYRVTPPGESSQASKVFDLSVRPFAYDEPHIQLELPLSPGRELSLTAVPEQGARFGLDYWVYMAPGQLVSIKAIGLLESGGTETLDLRPGAAEAVTEDEYYAEKLSVILPRAFLQRLRLSELFRVAVDVSFDDGNDYRQFPSVDFYLVP